MLFDFVTGEEWCIASVHNRLYSLIEHGSKFIGLRHVLRPSMFTPKVYLDSSRKCFVRHLNVLFWCLVIVMSHMLYE